jgi:hypothetical protein
VKLAAEQQAGRYVADPWSEHVLEYAFRHDNDVSFTQVLCHLMPVQNRPGDEANFRAHDQMSANRVARILVANGFRRYQKRVDGARPWRYHKVDDEGFPV